jgi:hypothetical protein
MLAPIHFFSILTIALLLNNVNYNHSFDPGPAAAIASVSSHQAASPKAGTRGSEPPRPKRARKAPRAYTPPAPDVPQLLTTKKTLSGPAGTPTSNVSAPASPARAPKDGLPGARTRSPSPMSPSEGARAGGNPVAEIPSQSKAVSKGKGPPTGVNPVGEISSQNKAASKGKRKSDVGESGESRPGVKRVGVDTAAES